MPKVLVYVPSLYRLGPAAPLMAGLPMFAARGMDVQLVTDEITNGLEGGLEVPVHRCRENRGERLWHFKLRKIARELRADVLHNWCGPAAVDFAWKGLRGRRFASAEDVSLASQLLKRSKSRVELLVLQDDTASMKRPDEFGCDSISVPCLQTGPAFPESTSQSDPDYFRSRFGIPAGSFVAVASARLEPWSRLKDLIWATDLLCCVRDDFHLVIAGTGHQQKRLERFARQTESSAHVHFHGLPKDPVAMIGSADLFWQSSPAASGRHAMFTAMSVGVPVISAAGTNCTGLVLHQQTGFLIPQGSRDGFARWSKFLIELPDQKTQLTKQASSHIAEIFPPGNQLERLADAWMA